MKESEITDEQILQEAEIIFKENPQLRKCSQCVHSNEECNICTKNNMPITRYQYCGLCPHYMTHEQRMIEETRANLRKHEKENRKVNHLLTMTLNCIDAAMLFFEDFSGRVEREYKIAEQRGLGDARVRKTDRAWMASLKKGIKAMKAHMDGMQKQYNHFVQPIYDKVFYDKGNGKYDVELYDDHQSDATELAHLVLRYFDVAYLNGGNAQKVIELMRTMDSCGVLEDKDFNHYNFRR